MSAAIPVELVAMSKSATPTEHWHALFEEVWATCSRPLDAGKAAAPQVSARDRELAPHDLFLAAAAWDLWGHYEAAVPRTADELAAWWSATPQGRAVLILDGLSLREAPWILEGARTRGYTIRQARATGSELPSDTTPFARALGFGTRGAIENNAGPASHRLPGARTDLMNAPWADCVGAIGSHPDIALWHCWPDERLHQLDGQGEGLLVFAEEAKARLTDESFWKLVERLATGRRLVITSDHGYAASGNFGDTPDPEQAHYLKSAFQAGRHSTGTAPQAAWMPPIDLALQTMHGDHRFALGRRKWKAGGGYPTLTHGGLSLLEVAAPFIEIQR